MKDGMMYCRYVGIRLQTLAYVSYILVYSIQQQTNDMV